MYGRCRKVQKDTWQFTDESQYWWPSFDATRYSARAANHYVPGTNGLSVDVARAWVTNISLGVGPNFQANRRVCNPQILLRQSERPSLEDDTNKTNAGRGGFNFWQFVINYYPGRHKTVPTRIGAPTRESDSRVTSGRYWFMVLLVTIVAVWDAATSDGFSNDSDHARRPDWSTHNPKLVHTKQITMQNNRSILCQDGNQFDQQTGAKARRVHNLGADSTRPSGAKGWDQQGMVFSYPQHQLSPDAWWDQYGKFGFGPAWANYPGIKREQLFNTPIVKKHTEEWKLKMTSKITSINNYRFSERKNCIRSVTP